MQVRRFALEHPAWLVRCPRIATAREIKPMRALIISSATLATLSMTAPQAAVAQSYGKPFCLQTSSGALECGYDTMAQCVEAAQASKGTCAPRPGTTGAAGLDAPRGTGANTLDRPPVLQPRAK
jgi:hypothetical protein